MPNTNDAIKAMLGTTQGSTANATATSNPALKNIATNGTLLVQGVSNLNKTLSTLLKSWGA